MKKFLMFLGLISAVILVPAGTLAAESDFLARDSFSAYLTDEYGSVLFEKAATERHEIASMTKIMTLNIAFKQIEEGKLSYDEDISVSERAAKTGGSTMFLDAGSSHKTEGLLKGIAIASANDAAVALAERISGSEEAFVEAMNAECAVLGMNDTRFANCTGLPAEGQYSCAKDVNAMTRALASHKDYFRFAGIRLEDYVHPSGRVTQLANTNKLLKNYEGCDAGKTGYTDNALHCLSATAQRGETRVFSTVIGASDSKARFRDASNMMNFAFANYETKLAAGKGELTERPEIAELKGDFKVGLADDLKVTVKKGTEFEKRLSFIENLEAPLKAGEKVGEMSIYRDGELIKTIDVVTLSDVQKAGFGDYIKKIASLW